MHPTCVFPGSLTAGQGGNRPQASGWQALGEGRRLSIRQPVTQRPKNFILKQM